MFATYCFSGQMLKVNVYIVEHTINRCYNNIQINEVCLNKLNQLISFQMIMDNKSFNSCLETTNHLEALNNEAFRLSVIFVLSFLPMITIAGNILVIITVLKRYRFRQRTNIFVVSLSVADLMVAVTVMPFAILQQFAEVSWTSRKDICLLSMSFDVMFTTTSILNLMCMTIDRYIAVCSPFRYHVLMSRRSVAGLLLTCWILPTILSFGFIFGKVHMIGIEDLYSCSETCFLRVNVHYSLISSFLSFYLPSMFMLVSNVRLFWKVKEKGKRIREISHETVHPAQMEQFLHREIKVARTIAILLSCFFLCWFPYFLLNIIDPFVNYSIGYIPWIIVTWLGYANSTINPYLYYVLNRPTKSTTHIIDLNRMCLKALAESNSITGSKFQRTRSVKKDGVLNNTKFLKIDSTQSVDLKEENDYRCKIV